MPTLVIRHPDGSEQEQDLANQITIGRADGNDLVLVEGGVSRKHARIFAQGPDVLIEDTGSANGTFVDGERIAAPTKLSPRAQVVIGDYEIVLKGAGKTAARAAPKGDGAPRAAPKGSDERTSAQAPVKAARATKVVPVVKGAAPASAQALVKRPRPGAGGPTGPSLRGLTGPWMNKTFALKGTMVVGRVPGVDIQLEDDSVSRRHGELVAQGRDVILRDLGSANGTAVNGHPVAEERVLKSGDIIQFGVVEMAYDSGTSGGVSAMAKGGGAGAPARQRPNRRPDPELDELPLGEITGTGAGGSPLRKKLLIGGGALGALLLIGATVSVFTEKPPPDPNPPPRTGPRVVDIDELLSQCRQYSSADLAEPNWEKASAACNEVLKENPIHPEALALLKKIELERGCEAAFNKGKKLMSRNREEEALEALKGVKAECSYYSKGKQLVLDAAAQVKKRAAEECKEYTSNGNWSEAFPRCQKYMDFACQEMTPEDLYPPVTQTLSITGPLRKNQWRPKDPMYIKFLTARAKVDPSAPPWKCTRNEILAPPPPPPDPARYAKEQFKARFDEPRMALAMSNYFVGKWREAVANYKNIKLDRDKAKWHAAADTLSKDMANISGLYNDGQNELSAERPDKAEEPFREALQLDEKIILGEEKMKLSDDERKKEIDRMTSYFRKTINQEMAQKCFDRGIALNDRKDAKQACKIWKLGYSFYKGNTDLLRAVSNICTAAASQAFGAMATCEDLPGVLEWAVDGDGFKEKALAKATELNCPGAAPAP